MSIPHLPHNIGWLQMHDHHFNSCGIGGYGQHLSGGYARPMSAEELAEYQKHQAQLQQAQIDALAQVQAQQTFLNHPSLQPNWMIPDRKQPDTLGWREWTWNAEQKCLQSPQMGTLWKSEKHKAVGWSRDDAVRGVAGIHAHLVPRHWRLLGEFGCYPLNGGGGGSLVTGIVERYGKYVLGTEGWRAEQVVIKELLAPSTEIGLELEQRYPNAIIHYPDQLEEGEQPCTSEKLSKSEKGNRRQLSFLLPFLSSGPSLSPSTPQPSPPSQSGSQFTLSPSAKTFQPNGPDELARIHARLRWAKTLWIMAGCVWVILLGVRFFAH